MYKLLISNSRIELEMLELEMFELGMLELEMLELEMLECNYKYVFFSVGICYITK